MVCMWGGGEEGRVKVCKGVKLLLLFCVCVCVCVCVPVHTFCASVCMQICTCRCSYQCVWAEVVTVQSNVTVSMLTLLTALHAILSERKTDRLETKTDWQVQFISSDLLHGLMGSNPCCLVTNDLPCISKTSPMRSVSSNDGMLTLLCKFMHPMFSHSHMLGSF